MNEKKYFTNLYQLLTCGVCVHVCEKVKLFTFTKILNL